MGRFKCKLEFAGVLEMLDKVEKMNINKNDACEKALKASKELVNNKLYKDTNKSNFPASGKYSHDQLRKSIDNDYNVQWQGMCCSIKIGYDFSISGVESVFLMYGTPRMNPARKLKSDIYGSKTQKDIRIKQKQTFNKIIARSM